MALKGSRSPHGERGLKFVRAAFVCAVRVSLPARGAWIEMQITGTTVTGNAASLPARGAWIEIDNADHHEGHDTGRSPHGERGLK